MCFKKLEIGPMSGSPSFLLDSLCQAVGVRSLFRSGQASLAMLAAYVQPRIAPDVQYQAPSLRSLPLTCMTYATPSLKSTSAHDSLCDLESVASFEMQGTWSPDDFTNDASDTDEGDRAPYAWPDTDSDDNEYPLPHSQIDIQADGTTLNLADLLPPPQKGSAFKVYQAQGEFTRAETVPVIYIPMVIPVHHPAWANFPQATSTDYPETVNSAATLLPSSSKKMPPSSKPRRYGPKAEASWLQEPSLSITTMMVRNVPLHVTQQEFIQELEENGFSGTYDFVYVPYSFKPKTNKGHAFVNFLSSQEAGVLVGKWHRQRIFNVGSRRPSLSIIPASIQGLEPNLLKLSCPNSQPQNEELLPHVVGEVAERLLKHLVQKSQM